METLNDIPPESTASWFGREKFLTLAIVFTDIEKSTQLTENFGDNWQDVRRAHFNRAKTLLRCHHGFLVKTIGDAVMAVFRDSVSALKFSMEFENNTGHEIVTIRVGLHVGRVSVENNDVFGPEVNLASRICDVAKPFGGILVSNQVHYDWTKHDPQSGLHWIQRQNIKIDGLRDAHTLWSLPRSKTPYPAVGADSNNLWKDATPSRLESPTFVRPAVGNSYANAQYWWQDIAADAIRLVGAQDEDFPSSQLEIAVESTPYKIPTALAMGRDEVLAAVEYDAKEKGHALWLGECVRLVRYRASPQDSSERKFLTLTLGPMNWSDYILTNQRFEDPGIAHHFRFKVNVSDYVDLDSLYRERSLDSCQLSNILTNYVTAITRDGFVVYSQRSAKVATYKNKLCSAVTENFHIEQDQPFGPAAVHAPFNAVARGIEEELSPLLRPKRPLSAIVLLGLEFHLQTYHPGLLYLVCLPFTKDEVVRALRERPGRDYHEGSIHFVALASEDDIRDVLSNPNWVHAGKASIIRSIEYLTDCAEKQGGSRLSIVANIAARWSSPI